MEILRDGAAMPNGTRKSFRHVLELMRDLDLRLDRDVHTGEEWARVFDADDLAALIRAPTSRSHSHRFAFVRVASSRRDAVRAILTPTGPR